MRKLNRVQKIEMRAKHQLLGIALLGDEVDAVAAVGYMTDIQKLLTKGEIISNTETVEEPGTAETASKARKQESGKTSA